MPSPRVMIAMSVKPGVRISWRRARRKFMIQGPFGV
jgi:hypothetical protein